MLWGQVDGARPKPRLSDDVLAEMLPTIRPGSSDELNLAIAVDDDACTLYERAGLRFDIGPDHPFAQREYARWGWAASRGLLYFACVGDGPPAGMMVLGHVNGEPHLDQLSVRTRFMRQGIGSRLVAFAVEWAGGRPLWLETYAHVPWNRPFYERHGFVVAPAARAPSEVQAFLAEQRRWLPAPAQRIVMCRSGAVGAMPG
jgi:GNAT superfamily N-acetyltransferase